MTSKEKLLVARAIRSFMAYEEEDYWNWELGMDILGNYIFNSRNPRKA